MSKLTAYAAGGATPAPGLMQSRRGLLTTLAASPLIGAIGAVALPAMAKPAIALPTTSEADATVFALRDKLAAIRQRKDAIMPSLDQASEAWETGHAGLPPRPEPTPEAAGMKEWEEVWGPKLREIVGKIPKPSEQEKRNHRAAEKAWLAKWRRLGRKTGYNQLSNDFEMLEQQEVEIINEMTDLPALSLAGLSAKIAEWEKGRPREIDLAWSIVENVMAMIKA